MRTQDFWQAGSHIEPNPGFGLLQDVAPVRMHVAGADIPFLSLPLCTSPVDACQLPRHFFPNPFTVKTSSRPAAHTQGEMERRVQIMDQCGPQGRVSTISSGRHSGKGNTNPRRWERPPGFWGQEQWEPQFGTESPLVSVMRSPGCAVAMALLGMHGLGMGLPGEGGAGLTEAGAAREAAGEALIRLAKHLLCHSPGRCQRRCWQRWAVRQDRRTRAAIPLPGMSRETRSSQGLLQNPRGCSAGGSCPQLHPCTPREGDIKWGQSPRMALAGPVPWTCCIPPAPGLHGQPKPCRNPPGEGVMGVFQPHAPCRDFAARCSDPKITALVPRVPP